MNRLLSLTALAMVVAGGAIVGCGENHEILGSRTESGGSSDAGSGGSGDASNGGDAPAEGGTGGDAGAAIGGSATGGSGEVAGTSAVTGGTSGSSGRGGQGGTGDSSSGGSNSGGSNTGGSNTGGSSTGGSNTGGAGMAGASGAGGVGGAACASLTTRAECDARTDCHTVLVDPGTCGCGSPGCCARFSRCADGYWVNCNGEAISCTITMPFCDRPTYVLSYANGCYEGCVDPKHCPVQ